MTPAQQEFVRRFKAYMANAGAAGSLSTYVKGLKAQDSRDCLDIYFDVAKPYGGREERKRAVGVFFDLSSRTLRVNDVYFSLQFDALTRAKETTWLKMYSALEFGPAKQAYERGFTSEEQPVGDTERFPDGVSQAHGTA